MAILNNIPEESRNLNPVFTWTNVYHPLVHKLLRPVFTRATLGSDVDCAELLRAFTSPAFKVVIVEEGQCSCCRAAGSWCIAAVKLSYAGGDKMGQVTEEVVVRCINCVINHKTCDLPRRTRAAICTCDWQIPDDDRKTIATRNRLSMMQAVQLGLPHDQRLSTDAINTVAFRFATFNSWFHHRAEMGYKMRLEHLEPAMDALGVTQLLRIDGRWILPFRNDWALCPCFPGSECGPERHLLDDSSDTIDGSMYAEDVGHHHRPTVNCHYGNSREAFDNENGLRFQGFVQQAINVAHEHIKNTTGQKEEVQCEKLVVKFNKGKGKSKGKV